MHNAFCNKIKSCFCGKVKLHIACGTLYKEGWVNIDNNLDHNINKLDLNHDLRKRLPFENNSVHFIYHEHFIEHLTYEEGLLFMQDCYRVLKKNGVMRIACPDLDALLKAYADDSWREGDWVKKYHCEWIESRGQMLNICMNVIPWGHKFIYNREDLKRRLELAGFKSEKIKIVKYGESKYEELINLDTRIDSMFFEVQKD